MIRLIFAAGILIHGLIHLLGFVKAFQWAEINQLTQNINKPIGVLWLVTSMLFIIALVLFILNQDSWRVIGVASLIFSQILIFSSWTDAKYGTIMNIIVLVVVILSAGSYMVEQKFKKSVLHNFKNNNKMDGEILTELDISHLPTLVQKYIRYTGSIGKQKVKNFKAIFTGGIRSNPEDDYMSFESTQYNFFHSPSRIFFIKANKMGLPAIGLHIYENAKAIFQIKLLGLIPIVDANGRKLDQGETVTLLNDMCFMAPATLIDERIKWSEIDDLSVIAYFTNGNITVSATLYFNERGELINFLSNDRYEINGKVYKNYPWLTPVKKYKDVNGWRLPSEAELIYIRPTGNFTYGKFKLSNLEYNRTN
jgi:hypothetical protein